jgi:FixJ family two-component response regulator
VWAVESRAPIVSEAKEAALSESSTVFIVDDEPVIRKSLAGLVEAAGLRAEPYENAQSFIEAYTPDRPGCIVLDLRMPGMSGLELQESLLSRGIRIPIIMVTAFGDVPSAVKACKLGCDDFFEKPFSEQQILDSIRRALERDRVERQKAERLRILKAKRDSLSPKEVAVYLGVVAGKSNKVVAVDLGLSAKTIEVHRANVMSKMGAKTLAELARISVELGDIPAA